MVVIGPALFKPGGNLSEQEGGQTQLPEPIKYELADLSVPQTQGDSPEEEVVTRGVPLMVIEHGYPEITGGTPQLVT